MTDEKNVHHQTRKGADMDLAKKAISPESHEAVHAGTLSLQQARELGRQGKPDVSGDILDGNDEPRYEDVPKPESRLSKDDRTTSKTCLCGCGEVLASGKRLFRQGHDTRLSRMSKEYVRGERELSEDQLRYAEESGKLEKARERVLEEDEKAAHAEEQKREREAKKQSDE